MGTYEYEENCPECDGKKTLRCLEDSKNVTNNHGVCLACGWGYCTESLQMNKKDLKRLQKDFGYKKVNKK